MWIGVPKDASVCLRCQLRINRSLRRQAPCWVRRHWPHARTQSTAAAVVQDLEEDVEEPQRKQRPPKKSKKGLRRVWKPPRVAELGVSSLGKPAEVLVLKDRDRHVPAAAEDKAERSKASQPRILEALQAENLPLSSESVKQSLDQIGDPYRQQSMALSVTQRTELRKKLMDGFTQDQLRSYCEEGHRPKIFSPTAPPANKNEVQKPSLRAPLPAGAARKAVTAAKGVLKFGKPALVDYIMKHKWALASLADERTEQHIPITTQKLKYILCHKQSSLKEYEEQFNVKFEASTQDGRLNIKGKFKQVHLAEGLVKSLCKDITSLRARSATTGEDLERFATPSFLHDLTRTYNVMICWASEQDENVKKHEDWLTICYHKKQDLQNALNAERAILRAEHDFSLTIEDIHLQPKISMWVFEGVSDSDFVLHHATERSNSLDRQKAWSRWVFPQKPIQKGYIKPGSEMSPAEQMVKHLASINRQSNSISKILKGNLDDFFKVLTLKKESGIRRLIDSGEVKEEIFAHFGKVLFPDGDATVAGAFYAIRNFGQSRLLRAKHSASTLISTDIPALPNYLKSLAPLEEIESAIDGTKGQKHTRKYRVQYVPLTSQLPSGFEAPTIEIDVLRDGKPGSVVTNHVTGAWAILAQQSHKLLTPGFAVDLIFGRRLKRQLIMSPVIGGGRSDQTIWLKQFGEQIKKLRSDQFPPFLKVTLPKYTVKYGSPEHVVDKDQSNVTQHDFNPQESTNVPAYASGPLKKPVRPTIVNGNFAIESPPKNIAYMLKSWEVVHATSYKAKQLCLEHLIVEDPNADEDRVLLRLARQPLFESDIRQLNIPLLIDRAFKIAAHLSDPRLIGQLNGRALFATKTHAEVA